MNFISLMKKNKRTFVFFDTYALYALWTYGKKCMIGMNSVIQAGVVLGDHVIVGANSTIVKGTYPSYCVLVGSPAKIVKIYNEIRKEWVKV